ncbi:MAG TPA: transposase, partial [Terriglobales bacterium]
PKAQVARELGIRVNQLRNWRLEFEEEEHVGAPKRATVQEDDVAKLDPASFPRTAAHAAINAAS